MNNVAATASVVIPNVHEYAQKGMDPDYPSLLMAKWRNVASGFSEPALFWEGDDKLVVSPRPIDAAFVDYITDLLKYRSISVITPQRCTTELSLDTLIDESVLSTISSFVSAREATHLRPWGATKQIYLLLDELKRRSPGLLCNELPTRDGYWSCTYIDSKLGFREMCIGLQEKAPGIHIPRGFTCDSLVSAQEVLRWFHATKLPCVLKASSGVGGYGNVFVLEELFDQPFEEVERYVYETTKALPYFRCGAVIIEEMIIPDGWKGTSSPACSRSVFMSGFIEADGRTTLVGGGTDIRDAQGHYVGAEIGKETYLDAVAGAIREMMYEIGDAIAGYGYRGHWGVNFIVSHASPVAIELNARRCGESHAYAIAEKLYGTKWMSDCYAITRLPIRVQAQPGALVGSVLRAFEKTNRTCIPKGILAIPTQVSWLGQAMPGLGYVVLGTDRDAVRAVENHLHDALAAEGVVCKDG